MSQGLSKTILEILNKSDIMLRQLLNIFLFFPPGFLSLTMNNAIGLVLFLAQLFISVICISTFHAHLS